jgi:hypothetical protein
MRETVARTRQEGETVSDQRLPPDTDHRGEGPLYREVDSAVRARLAELAEVTRFADDAALAAVARVELPKLADTVSQLLAAHHPDDSGRCRTCKHPWYRRGAAAPCRAYLSAYLRLLAATDDKKRE